MINNINYDIISENIFRIIEEENKEELFIQNDLRGDKKLEPAELYPKCKKLYHTSNPYFRNEISKNGLIPKIGESYSLWYGDHGYKNIPKCVFLSMEPYNSSYDDDLYEIDVEQLDTNSLYKDPETDGIMYFKTIPLSAIRLIYKGKVNDDTYIWNYDDNITLLIDDDKNGNEGRLSIHDRKGNEIGYCLYMICSVDEIESMYEDSIDPAEDDDENSSGYDHDSLRRLDWNSEVCDIDLFQINPPYINKGLFRKAFFFSLKHLAEKMENPQFVLRADPQYIDKTHKMIPIEKLESLYQEFGFVTTQETPNDGMIMIKTK